MRTVLVALVIALAASAGACWFYLDVIEGELRAHHAEVLRHKDEILQRSVEAPELAEAFGNLDELADEYLPDAVAEARAWTWRHVYPRLVVFTFLCALVTARLSGRLAPEEPA